MIASKSRDTYTVLAVPAADAIAEVVFPVRSSSHGVGGWWCRFYRGPSRGLRKG